MRPDLTEFACAPACSEVTGSLGLDLYLYLGLDFALLALSWQTWTWPLSTWTWTWPRHLATVVLDYLDLASPGLDLAALNLASPDLDLAHSNLASPCTVDECGYRAVLPSS